MIAAALLDSPSAPFRRAFALAAMLTALAASGARGADYRQGEEIVITGRVTDTAGRPVPGLAVRLVATRSKISLRKPGRVRGHATEIAVTSGAEGEYRLSWSWHDFYNRFELVLSLRSAQGESGWRELERQQISDRITHGSPVVVNLDAGAGEELERHRSFYSTLANAAERQVFEQMGAPDRVDRLTVGGHAEVTWWYFHDGSAYRFIDGRVEEITRFEPVRSF